jgi:hypothetical protein
MESPQDPTRDYLLELGWAALMVNVILALVGLLVGAQLGDLLLGLGLFLGGGLAVTAILGCLVALNMAVVRWRHRRH